MPRRRLRILKWIALAATLVTLAAFAISSRGLSYSARPCEIALSHYHVIVMTRDRRDLALQYATFGWSRGHSRYLMNPGLQHWHTSAPWGTGTAIPLWMPLAALGTLTIALFALDFRNRRRPGLCPKCRYDLRGLAPNSPCPECGPDLPVC